MKAMFRIYYSPLETKFKLVFDIYDFDGDGVISKEDVHLVLSHIPMSVILIYLLILHIAFSINLLKCYDLPRINGQPILRGL
jgi:hypothetical protein